MPEEVLERERLLREDVERELPEFVTACAADESFVIMHQDALAPMLGSQEMFLLGKAIKYAGLPGKEVRIVRSARRPRTSSERSGQILASSTGNRVRRSHRSRLAVVRRLVIVDLVARVLPCLLGSICFAPEVPGHRMVPS